MDNRKINYTSVSMGDVIPDHKRRNSHWTIDGVDYYVGKFLGKGTFGEVNYCDGVISKRIRYHAKNQKKACADFEREIELAGTRYEFSFGVHYPQYNTFIFCMPFIPGHFYKKLSHDKTYYTLAPELSTRSSFFRQYFNILLEVYFLHVKFGIVHGDIKFANLKMYHNQVFLVDFGMAYKIGEMTAPIEQVDYLAPELRRGVKANPAIDVYSLGFLLYTYEREINILLRTENPKSTSILDIPELKNLFLKMTKKNPLERIDLRTAMTEYVNFFNKSVFGKHNPIVFDAKNIERDFKPSTLPHVMPANKEYKKEKSQVTFFEETVIKRRKAKPTLAPPPSPATSKLNP